MSLNQQVRLCPDSEFDASGSLILDSQLWILNLILFNFPIKLFGTFKGNCVREEYQGSDAIRFLYWSHQIDIRRCVEFVCMICWLIRQAGSRAVRFQGEGWGHARFYSDSDFEMNSRRISERSGMCEENNDTCEPWTCESRSSYSHPKLPGWTVNWTNRSLWPWIQI
jgi:hypothetical protein